MGPMLALWTLLSGIFPLAVYFLLTDSYSLYNWIHTESIHFCHPTEYKGPDLKLYIYCIVICLHQQDDLYFKLDLFAFDMYI